MDSWVRAFNRLLNAISDQSSGAYFSGPRFMNLVREVDPHHPDYHQFVDDRRRRGLSTSRKDFFFDILRDLPEASRYQVLHRIFEEAAEFAPAVVEEARGLIADPLPGPQAHVQEGTWSAERLNRVLAVIDASIAAGDYERAVSLSYQVLEGFYKAFVRHRTPGTPVKDEIVALSRVVKEVVSKSSPDYPPEILNMVSHVTHAVDRARNQLGEAHFDREAARWLAVYVRDLANTQMRLLLHFFDE